LNNLKKKELSDDYLNGLKNTIVMEMTPNGNVIMYWDNSRDAFVYYSDSTIPYRFLEVVARKYAIVNDCLNIFIIRKEEEEDKSEDKSEAKDKSEATVKSEAKEEEEEDKIEAKEDKSEATVKSEAKEEEEDKSEAKEDKSEAKEKRSVFAKLKNYNKGSMQISSVNYRPDKKDINEPNKNKENNEEEKSENKEEKTNTYSREGKIINYSFLKKVDSKLVNKKMNMTFSEFKLKKKIENIM
jgi:hypothetical protein